MNAQARARITAEFGCIHYGSVREAVKALKWKGYDIEVMEGHGWLSRTFYFTGSVKAIQILKMLFDDLDRDDG